MLLVQMEVAQVVGKWLSPLIFVKYRGNRSPCVRSRLHSTLLQIAILKRETKIQNLIVFFYFKKSHKSARSCGRERGWHLSNKNTIINTLSNALKQKTGNLDSSAEQTSYVKHSHSWRPGHLTSSLLRKANYTITNCDCNQTSAVRQDIKPARRSSRA